jgi:hypothetical protein
MSSRTANPTLGFLIMVGAALVVAIAIAAIRSLVTWLTE